MYSYGLLECSIFKPTQLVEEERASACQPTCDVELINEYVTKHRLQTLPSKTPCEACQIREPERDTSGNLGYLRKHKQIEMENNADNCTPEHGSYHSQEDEVQDIIWNYLEISTP